MGDHGARVISVMYTQSARYAAIHACTAGLRSPSRAALLRVSLLSVLATEKHSIFGRMGEVRSAFDASADGMTASFSGLRVSENLGIYIFNRSTELSLRR